MKPISLENAKKGDVIICYEGWRKSIYSFSSHIIAQTFKKVVVTTKGEKFSIKSGHYHDWFNGGEMPHMFAVELIKRGM